MFKVSCNIIIGRNIYWNWQDFGSIFGNDAQAMNICQETDHVIDENDNQVHPKNEPMLKLLSSLYLTISFERVERI